MVTTALNRALWRRDHSGAAIGADLIHYSDAGNQYTSIAFAETLVLEGIAASIGSIGDAYDNAPAEITIGMFKTEAIAAGSPFRTGPLRTIDDVEYITMEWSTGTTTGGTACWTTSHPKNTRPPTTLTSRRPSRRRLNYEAASNRDGLSRSAR